jgi:hypothetical protein
MFTQARVLVPLVMDMPLGLVSMVWYGNKVLSYSSCCQEFDGQRNISAGWDLQIVNIVPCSAVHCNTVQCRAVPCSAVQCSAVQCSAVQCSAVQ